MSAYETELSQEASISREIALAVEALDELRNSHGQKQQDTLLDKVRSNSIINNAVRVYEQSKSQYPSFRKGAEIMERKALFPMVRRIEKTSNKWKSREKHGRDDEICSGSEKETEDEDDGSTILDDRTYGVRVSKRQKISRAIAKSKDSFKEYKLNMSIESKKRLITCLHLLKLANTQLSNRVNSLQDLVVKEQRLLRHKSANPEDEESDDEEYYDASDNLNEQSKVIKTEVVGTVKKVYSLVSKFAGNSLPEPARTQVRESLLKLPLNWTDYMNEENLAKFDPDLTANGKVLILAKESLEMVHSVMSVVDNTLGKAEEWVKHKQEIKQMLKEQFRNAQFREKVKREMAKEDSSV
ncbi:LAMI_0F10088g1_1 [Lachancea mirantina]|uniref:LAMI_0F10088g1_1 n=1 Tax=Lachancea mirantina TaxID=1230905 RepID=A0A1G4K1J7_9SACH|nr:LAMI_0F10088g1_1 [Lachancea mirantina]